VEAPSRPRALASPDVRDKIGATLAGLVERLFYSPEGEATADGIGPGFPTLGVVLWRE
jgi:hypothetical protein